MLPSVDKDKNNQSSDGSKSRLTSPVAKKRKKSKSETESAKETLKIMQRAPGPVGSFVPSEEPDIIASQSFIEYGAADQEEKKFLLKKSARVMRKYNEEERFRQMHMWVALSWKRDKVLNQNWNYRANFTLQNGVSLQTIYQLIGQRVSLLRTPEMEGKKGKRKSKKGKKRISENWEKFVSPDWLAEYADNQQYHAPETRIMITRNITFNEKDIVPVLTDVQSETVENLHIPDSLTYEYRDVNQVAAGEDDLKKAVEMAMEEQNLIRCNCRVGEDDMCYCFRNEKCPCYVTNRAMLQLQQSNIEANVNPRDRVPTEFSTLNPIIFNQVENPFYEFVGFACSELCSCKGQCTNNALYIAQNHRIPLEVYRADLDLGFSLRSPAIIPVGTPFLEFVGEISDEDYMTEESDDYIYKLTDPEDKKWTSFVLKHKTWTAPYAKLLRKLSTKTFHCNPKYYGNAARTVLHSCIANTDIVRIYQKSLSPAHARLVMVSLEDIHPGTPITLDYGKEYIDTQLTGICKCGTFACHNGKHHKEFSALSPFQISCCLMALFNHSRKIFHETVPLQAKKHKEAVKKIVDNKLKQIRVIEATNNQENGSQ